MSNDNIPKLSKKDNITQAIKFTVFSLSAGAIQFGTFTLLDKITNLSYWPMYLPALILSFVYNFTINRKFTFKSANNVPVAMLKVAAYYAVFTPLSTLWGDALTDRLGWNYYVVLICTMLINFVTEFLFDRFVVFGKTINTNEIAQREQKPEEQEPEEIMQDT